MSRCFPFPPPGYERKARTDEVDLLKKEKHKEKKHKKEEKNDKREGNEIRENGRSDEKHQEKSEKKEKYSDKDTKRDKEKAKYKSNASDEKRISGETKNPSGEVIHKEGKYLNNRNGKKSPFIVDKSSLGPFAGYMTDKINQSNHHDEYNRDFKLVHELGRRIKNDARRTGIPIKTFTCLDQKMDGGMVRLVAKGTGGTNEFTEKNKDKKVQDKGKDGMGARGNTMVLVGVVQSSEGTSRTVDKNVFRKVEGKEKENDDKPGDKRKVKDKEKRSHGKDKDRKKEEKEKAKEKIQVRNISPDKIRKNNNNHFLCANAIRTAELPMDSNSSAGTEGNHKKRKDLEINGVFHAHDIKHTKLPKPAPSSAMKNGRVLEICQTSMFDTSGKKVAANNFKVPNEECERNGTIEAPKSSVSHMKLKPPKPQVDLAKSSTRPSHPDSKYLSKIYSVPNIQELSNLDDQEWLFSSNGLEHKKPGIEASSVQDTPHVWAKALQIGSADVCALPCTGNWPIFCCCCCCTILFLFNSLAVSEETDSSESRTIGNIDGSSRCGSKWLRG